MRGGRGPGSGVWVCGVYRFAGGCVCTVCGCLCWCDFVSVAPSGPVHVIMHVTACPSVYVYLSEVKFDFLRWPLYCDPALLWLSQAGLGKGGVCVWIIWGWGCGSLDQGILL